MTDDDRLAATADAWATSIPDPEEYDVDGVSRQEAFIAGAQWARAQAEARIAELEGQVTNNVGRFHWRDGISFQRVTADNMADAQEHGIHWEHAAAPGDVRLFMGARDSQGFVIPAAEWASIIAAVCSRNETAESYADAQKFHG